MVMFCCRARGICDCTHKYIACTTPFQCSRAAAAAEVIRSREQIDKTGQKMKRKRPPHADAQTQPPLAARGRRTKYNGAAAAATARVTTVVTSSSRRRRRGAPVRYRPRARRLLNDIAQVSATAPRDLAGALVEALFGDPRTAENIVRAWFRTAQRKRPATLADLLRAVGPKPPPRKRQKTMTNPAMDRLARFFFFLAATPLDIRVRMHLMAWPTGDETVDGGGEGGMRLFLLPFGSVDHSSSSSSVDDTNNNKDRLDFVPHLRIPVEYMDPRVTEVVRVLVYRKGCLRQLTEDPTTGHHTFWSLGQHVEARQAMVRCRPMFLVAAFRAFLVELRWESSKDIATNSSRGATTTAQQRVWSARGRYGRRPPRVPVCPAAAAMERHRIEELRQAIDSLRPRSKRQQTALQLLRNAMEFVLTGQDHMDDTPRLGTWRYIPSDEALEQFTRETVVQWSEMLSA